MERKILRGLLYFVMAMSGWFAFVLIFGPGGSELPSIVGRVGDRAAAVACFTVSLAGLAASAKRDH